MTRLVGRGRRCGGLRDGSTERRRQIGANVPNLNPNRRSEGSSASYANAPLPAFDQAQHPRRDTYFATNFSARTPAGGDMIGDFHAA